VFIRWLKEIRFPAQKLLAKSILDEWLTKRIKKEEAQEIFNQPVKIEEKK
jgi:hypothetical protein